SAFILLILKMHDYEAGLTGFSLFKDQYGLSVIADHRYIEDPRVTALPREAYEEASTREGNLEFDRNTFDNGVDTRIADRKRSVEQKREEVFLNGYETSRTEALEQAIKGRQELRK